MIFWGFINIFKLLNLIGARLNALKIHVFKFNFISEGFYIYFEKSLHHQLQLFLATCPQSYIVFWLLHSNFEFLIWMKMLDSFWIESTLLPKLQQRSPLDLFFSALFQDKSRRFSINSCQHKARPQYKIPYKLIQTKSKSFIFKFLKVLFLFKALMRILIIDPKNVQNQIIKWTVLELIMMSSQNWLK